MTGGMKTVVLMIVSISATVSCGPQPLSKEQLIQFGVEQESSTRKAIADSYLRWIDATKAKDVDAVLALYDDDAVILPDNGNTVNGKDAIRVFYKQWYSGKDKLVKQQFDDTGLYMNSSDIAIETADFSGVSNVNGKESTFRGKNLIVWKREADGSWKIFRDIWNGSPAK